MQSFLALALVCSSVLFASAKIDEAGVVEIDDINLSRSNSSKCLPVKKLGVDFLSVIRRGDQVILGGALAKYDNATKTLKTTDPNVSPITLSYEVVNGSDGKPENSFFFTVNMDDGVCVYDIDMAAGTLFGLTDDDDDTEKVLESGVVMLGADDHTKSAPDANCTDQESSNSAYVSYQEEHETRVVLDDIRGDFAIDERREAFLLDGSKLSKQDDGQLLLITGRPGHTCAYPVKVVDGTVMGIAPQSRRLTNLRSAQTNDVTSY